MSAALLFSAAGASAASAGQKDPAPIVLPEFAKNYVPTGPLIVDNGFRPSRNGFSFDNYANDATTQNLTPTQMVSLFGPAVCANENDPSDCVLIPTAQQWMTVWNKNMDNGHCMGLAVSAELFYASLGEPSSPAAFGAATVPALKLKANRPLQSHIARGYTYQALPQVEKATIKSKPSVILSRLQEALKTGDEVYTIGIFQRDDTGGHAVTPYAIEKRGGGKFRILVYDNNMPLITRAMDINTRKETWSYEASPIPSVLPDIYEGDAKSHTLWLLPTKVALTQQHCPFCRDATGTPASPDSTNPRTLYWTGNPEDLHHSDIVVRDDSGRESGCSVVDGQYKCLNDIPGVRTQQMLLEASGVPVWEQSSPPSFTLPARALTVEIQGRQTEDPEAEGIHVIGSGLAMAVEGIRVKDGETDRIKIGRTGQSLDFRASADSVSRPVVSIGVNGAADSYEFELTPNKAAGGAYANVTLLPAKQQLIVQAGANSATSYSLHQRRLNASGEQVNLPPTEILAGQRVTIHY